MKNIFITGVSGTGKTTVANALSERGISAISIDEIPGLCYWISKNDGKKVEYEAKLNQDFINSHEWVCDVEELKKILKTSDESVVLGHVENENDLLPLFDKVLLLKCQPETFMGRILERKDNDFGKDETAQRYLLNTYQEFEKNMISKGAIVINTEKPLEEVVLTVIAEIR